MPIEFRDTAGDPVTTLSFTGVIPGSATASQEVRIWNSMGSTTAATIYGAQLIAAVEWPAGSGTYVFTGAPPVDERWLEVKANGGTNVTVAGTDWKPLGAGCSFPLVAILEEDEAEHVLARVRPPAGTSVGSGNLRWRLVAVSDLSLALPRGGSETGADGVLRWIGDSSVTALIVGAPYTESSLVGSSIECGYEAAVIAGVPVAYPAEQIVVDDEDGAAVALTSGKEYRWVVSLAPDGTRTATKGLLANIGLAVAPAGPAGEVLTAEVLRQFDGLINNADIEMLELPGRYSYLGASGLVVTLGPGEMRVDNRLLRDAAVTQLTLVASDTNYVWRQPSGPWAVTQTAAAPVPGAALVWEFDTDGSTVTAYRDRRLFVGGLERRLKMEISGVLVATTVSAPDVNAEPRVLYLDPERAVVFALGNLGITLASGETRVDVQISGAGGAYASIYAADDDMPAVAWDATDPVARESRPATLTVPAYARAVAVIDGIPAGVTAPTGATVVLQGVLRR